MREFLDRDVAVREVYLDLIQRAMYEVGSLWESNHISVATEHMASCVAEELLNVLFRETSAATLSPQSRVLVACVQPEMHQLGSRIVADCLESHGYDTTFVGANTPSGELLRLIGECQPDLVALSLTVYFNLSALLSFIENTSRQFPHLKLLVGGQGLEGRGERLASPFQQVTYFPSIDCLKALRPPADAALEGTVP